MLQRDDAATRPVRILLYHRVPSTNAEYLKYTDQPQPRVNVTVEAIQLREILVGKKLGPQSKLHR